MNTNFTYSILQYKHSALTREAVNVGILFAFFDESHLEFVVGGAHRVKSIYLDFDINVFTSSLNFIKNKIGSKSVTSLFSQSGIRENFAQYINGSLLSPDATALQFTEPRSAISVTDKDSTIKEYTKLLISGIDVKRQELVRHNEVYIIREFTNYLFEKDRGISKKIDKEPFVFYNDISLKFDLSWQNGTKNYVKALSFDLKEPQDIQTKSTTFFGYFTLLKDFPSIHNARFDILVARPQDRKLWKEYDKAVDNLQKADTNKLIVEQSELKKYSIKARESLESW